MSIASEANSPGGAALGEVVRIPSAGDTLIGRLVLPPPRPIDGARPPVVVVAGSWTTVKEQMAANYVPHLTDAGFAVLTFDYRGYGESTGQPRDLESGPMKAQDISAVVTWLAEHSAVDPGRIGLMPICASASYTTMAAMDETRIASIAMVAPWLHDRTIVEAIYGGPAGVEGRLQKAHAARHKFETTGVVDYIKAASNTDPTAAMYWEGDALDYYLNPNRGAIPQWSARFAVMAWKDWLELDAIALAPRVNAPTLLITGPGTATPGGAKQFAALMRAPQRLVELDGSQFDFYDNPATVAAAAREAIAHFRSTMDAN
jgi:pimeloyl-ACP methyl ester carboxylesterase